MIFTLFRNWICFQHQKRTAWTPTFAHHSLPFDYWNLRHISAQTFGNYALDTVQEFFDQVGHQTMYASIGNKHFFTK